MQTLSAGQYQGDPTVLSQLRKFGKGLSNKQQVQAERGAGARLVVPIPGAMFPNARQRERVVQMGAENIRRTVRSTKHETKCLLCLGEPFKEICGQSWSFGP